MKRILMINSVPYGSTAKIMLGIGVIAEANGFDVTVASGYSFHPLEEISKLTQIKYIRIGNLIDKYFHMHLSKVFGNHGVYSKIATRNFIRKVKKLEPDIIHFHNVHGWYLNYPMLFEYLKKTNASVVWTLHDCWAFTGGCSHFTFSKCERWKSGCGGCNNLGKYPIASKIDRTNYMYDLKSRCFSEMRDMTIVTPSQWLADLVKQSFLKDYPVKVINNGIDLNMFHPMESDFRKKYGIGNKKIVLGVSFGWDERKGLDVFKELCKRLDDTYQIVLVGTDDNTDSQLPEGIVSIHRTQNQKELAEIYSAADVFVNPTREDNYPTVNMEAIACGTPVITFRTGGSPEMLDENCGFVVDCDDMEALEKEIIRMCTEELVLKEHCVKKSQEFDMNKRYKEYVELYERIDTAGNKTD